MKLVCYCFGYSAEDIERDVLEHQGLSEIEARITKAREQGTCQCETKNPRKT